MNRPEGGGLAGKLDCNPLLYLRAAETLLLLATASGLAVSVKRSLLEQAGPRDSQELSRHRAGEGNNPCRRDYRAGQATSHLAGPPRSRGQIRQAYLGTATFKENRALCGA